MRLLYTVFPFHEEARGAAKFLIENKLVACANYWPVKSMYYFENTFKEKDETVMILKVPLQSLDMVRKKIRELNSYHVPSIIVLKPESVNNNYLLWVRGVDSSNQTKENYDGA